MKLFSSFTLLLFLMLVVSAPALAQRATLAGTVTDPSGAVVPGASITAIKIDQGLKREAVTDGKGNFTLSQLPPGRYAVTVRQQGFAPTTLEDVALYVEDQIHVNIQLAVGKITDSVTVTAQASEIQTAVSLGMLVNRDYLEQIPLNGRTLQSLIMIAPGVVRTGGAGQFSVNGQRDTTNYFTLDGIGANIGFGNSKYGWVSGISYGGNLPSFNALGTTTNMVAVDAVEEFKVSTSTYSAEYGRGPGAQIQLTTRAGTNQYHGGLFEYVRNEIFDANDWFANKANQARVPMRQNQFGGTFGGPIIKDRTFFFGSVEILKLRLPRFESWPVPSVSIRQDAPADVKPFLNAYPLPNANSVENMTTRTATYTNAVSDPSSERSTGLRIDHVVNNKLTLFGRYGNSLSERAMTQLSFSLPTQAISRTITAGGTYIFTPRLLSETRFNYSTNSNKNSYELLPVNGAVPISNDLIAKYAPTGTKILNWAVLNSTTLALGQSSKVHQRQLNAVENVTATVGSHVLKFGADYRGLLPGLDPQNGMTVYFFSASRVLTQTADSVSIIYYDQASIASRNFSFFAQDSWRATRSLTLDLGLRWDLNPPPAELGSTHLRTLTNINDAANVKMAPIGTPMYPTYYRAFGPRTGVALALRGTPGWETVVRGGYGLYFSLGSGAGFSPANTFPHQQSARYSAVAFPLTDAQRTAPPQKSVDPPYSGQTFIAFDPAYTLPRTHQWNLTLQQTLGRSQTISVAYVGSASRRLSRMEKLTDPNANFSVCTIFVTQNSPDFSDTSDYHGMQVNFQRRMAKGLQASANYTWSHSLDSNADDDFVANRSDKISPNSDRASSANDRRHVFNSLITYSMPSTPERLGKVAKLITGGWALDTIIKAESAAPIDVNLSRDLGWGYISVRPDVVPGVPLWLYDTNYAGGRRINPAAFTVSPDLRQGNLQRNTLRAFGLYQLDGALRRQFKIKEGMTLQLRGEVYNFLNHPNFSGIYGTLGSYSSGKLTPSTIFGYSRQMGNKATGANGLNSLYQIGGPRSIQIALKLVF